MCLEMSYRCLEVTCFKCLAIGMSGDLCAYMYRCSEVSRHV